jgi:aminopeptidase N
MRRLLALLACFAVGAVSADAQVPDNAMGKGVSLELAQWRTRTIRQVRIDLRLDVTSLDSASGHVTLSFDRSGPDDAVIDFRGRRITRIIANGADLPSSIFNGAHLRIPAANLRTGENAIAVDFVSEIAPSGTSIIRTHDQTDNSDYLYTLLVPADANQLFPSFDQPDLKARVTFSLVAPRAWTTLANGSEHAADTTNDRITHYFTETKPLSTYLIAFAAGPWQKATSTVNGRPISVYLRKSRFKEADTDTLLALSHRAVTWMEQYFDRPYPFEKIDFLLAPAFPFGGMEHPGAIFYNETGFIFRERPTLTRRLGRFSTILHETAHQWFGDLVTMRWFDDLWLKEGFATYMAAKAQFALDSTSGAWKTFHSNKPTAYAVDQTTGTNSLVQKLVNLDQAKSNYGPIVYNKAPSVLKQLNYLIGEPAFQQGVRAFLATHAYANATWQDLLGAIGTAANKPMGAFGRNFMLRAGMPVVEQQLTVRNNRITKLELVQHPAQPLSGNAPWPMRTQVLLWYGKARTPVTIPVELSAVTTVVAAAQGRPAPLFVFANFEDYGYFLTLLDDRSVDALEHGALGDVTDPFLRTMLWGALWDKVRDATFDPARFARLALAELPREKDEQLVPVVLGRLTRAVSTYAATTERDRLRPVLEQALLAGMNDASRPYGIRRANLDAFIGTASTTDGISALVNLYDVDSVAGEPMRDPTRWSIVNRLTVLGAPGAAALVVRQTARDSTPDGRRQRFIAGAAVPSADVKRDYFARYFADKSLNEDWVSGSLGAFNASEHAELTLPYLRPALDSLAYVQANRRIFFLGSWLGGFIGGQRTQAALDIVRRYLAENPSLPLDLRQKVLQSADDLERTVKIRNRWK